MTATELEKNIYGDDVKIISRTDDCTVYRLEDEAGYIDMTCYSVFPGIYLVYDDVHMHGNFRENAKPGNIFELNHCRDGRFECEFEKGSCYLGPGDLTVCCKPDSGYGSSFPLGYYRGITIVVDVDKTPECLSYVLGDVNVDPKQLMSRFYAGGRDIYPAPTRLSIISFPNFTAAFPRISAKAISRSRYSNCSCFSALSTLKTIPARMISFRDRR